MPSVFPKESRCAAFATIETFPPRPEPHERILFNFVDSIDESTCLDVDSELPDFAGEDDDGVSAGRVAVLPCKFMNCWSCVASRSAGPIPGGGMDEFAQFFAELPHTCAALDGLSADGLGDSANDVPLDYADDHVVRTAQYRASLM